MEHHEPVLSILIPVYNWDVSELLRELAQQIRANDLCGEVDLHVFNDASLQTYSHALFQVAAELREAGVLVHVYGVEANAGRAHARNALLTNSTGRYLLFLDADVLPDASDFVATYLAQARSAREVVCGGVSYRRCGTVSAVHRFYHRYSSTTSVAPASRRNSVPWAWVFTANMLVSRRVATLVPFDAGFVGYGYEDLEWGLRLHQQCGIVHLDNTVSHLGLLTKAVLQRKNAEAAPNLVHLSRLHPALSEALSLVRLGRRLASTPTLFLQSAAWVGGQLFLSERWGYRVAWLGMQLEKLSRAALAFKAKVVR